MFKESFQLSYLDLFLVSQIKRVVKLHNGILFTTPSNLSLHKKRQSKQNNQRPPPSPNKIVIIKNIKYFLCFSAIYFSFPKRHAGPSMVPRSKNKMNVQNVSSFI